MYLDDWLVVSRSEAQATRDIMATCALTSQLGFIINQKKSHLLPTQTPTFLGAIVNLHSGVAVPTEDRLTNLRMCIDLFLTSEVAPARAWLKLLGLLASLVDLVPWCRLRMRPLQMHLLAFYRPKTDPITLPVPISHHIRAHLLWWRTDHNVRQGVQFPHKDPQVVIFTDASNEGWGASLGPRQAAGTLDE